MHFSEVNENVFPFLDIWQMTFLTFYSLFCIFAFDFKLNNSDIFLFLTFKKWVDISVWTRSINKQFIFFFNLDLPIILPLFLISTFVFIYWFRKYPFFTVHLIIFYKYFLKIHCTYLLVRLYHRADFHNLFDTSVVFFVNMKSKLKHCRQWEDACMFDAN